MSAEQEIERWADDHFTQGEVATVMALVREHGWGPPSEPVPTVDREALAQAIEARWTFNGEVTDHAQIAARIVRTHGTGGE